MCSENFDKKIYNFGHCPMLYGLYNCYGRHESISLSPDDFWLMIIQSFSIYVLNHSEKLRKKFVNFEGKKTLNINLEEGKLEELTKEKYEECFNNFNEQISAYIGKDLVDNLQANFSTSTINEKTVSKISIMTALQNYFEYKIVCWGCGFPSITLRGILEDYEQILEKMKLLKNFELEWWYNILKPIIEKIIETKKCLTENRKENIDYEFWRQMIKKETKKKKNQKIPILENMKLILFLDGLFIFSPLVKREIKELIEIYQELKFKLNQDFLLKQIVKIFLVKCYVSLLKFLRLCIKLIIIVIFIMDFLALKEIIIKE